MKSASGIGRRIDHCIRSIAARDYESALVNLFPAMDKTAKRRRPKDGVGSRIGEFVRDEEGIISAIATNNIFRNINVNGVDFPTAIYKFGRSAILHEGELDPRLQFNESGSLQIGDVWNLPVPYITAMSVSVVVAPENVNESLKHSRRLTIFDKTFNLNELWGQRTIVKELICEVFKNPNAVE